MCSKLVTLLMGQCPQSLTGFLKEWRYWAMHTYRIDKSPTPENLECAHIVSLQRSREGQFWLWLWLWVIYAAKVPFSELSLNSVSASSGQLYGDWAGVHIIIQVLVSTSIKEKMSASIWPISNISTVLLSVVTNARFFFFNGGIGKDAHTHSKMPWRNHPNHQLTRDVVRSASYLAPKRVVLRQVIRKQWLWVM